MNCKNYSELFNEMHPDFFAPEKTMHMPEQKIYEEQILTGADACNAEIDIPVPEDVTFGFYSGSINDIRRTIAEVDSSWPEIFSGTDRIYCGFVHGEIASFCLVEDMGSHMLNGTLLHIGGPGCVGTVPKFRRQGIGLKMVQNVTKLLFAEGYDISYIHYTGVGRWYEKLGYRTVLRWNRNGIL